MKHPVSSPSVTTTTRPQPRRLDAAAVVFRRRVKVIDRIARSLISISGVAIICAVLGIGVFLLWEILPLFAPAQVRPGLSASVLPAGEPPRLVIIDEHQERACVLGTEPVVHVIALSDGATIQRAPLEELVGQQVRAVSRQIRDPHVAIGTDQGNVWLGEISFQTVFDGSTRRIQARIEPEAVLQATPGVAIKALAYRETGPQAVAATVAEAGQLIVTRLTLHRPLIGPIRRRLESLRVPMESFGVPTTVSLSEETTQLLVGTDAGFVTRWRIPSEGMPELLEAVQAVPRGPVQTLAALLGDRSILVGGGDGSVASWSLVRQNGYADDRRLTRLHVFPAHAAAVTSIAPSGRDKGFVSASADGVVRLHYMTSERTLAEWSLPASPLAMDFAPKANGTALLDDQGRLHHWSIRNPHPEFSWKSLFGKVWYEGYPAPDYVWQSTGGTDDFESKFSLVPLIFGTLKGTFYAMLFAVPLALFGALYCSQFLETPLRFPIKSTIELMAALPSVVLGFIAGVVMAPLVQHQLVAVLLIPVMVPAVAVLGALAARAIGPLHPLVQAHEFWTLLVWIGIGVVLCGWMAPWVERLAFGGDVEAWLLEATGLRYDQRNALIVGWAMGFAVIPMIFTICEDAFSSVPKHLVGASLACGASPWQTAWRVVLPAAGSGVFSAVMIGFGRAVGETMIVLMATGNTPIMEWSLFNGFRALSANIAVEIPEAPYGQTLYRMLFMAALLLFVMTSIVNTVAEVIRLRLRRQLQGL